MTIATDLAAAFASAGFRVSSIEPPAQSINNGLTEEERAARRVEAGRRAIEKHRQRVAAYIAEWEAIESTRRNIPAEPTEQRRTKGLFACIALDGSRVERDLHATMLDKLFDAGSITDEQCQGGQDFAVLMERMRLVPAGRSCLDNSPRGFDDTAEPTHGELRDEEERQRLHSACGSLVWAELRRVCVEQCNPRSIDRLRIGLDQCVKLWC